MYTCDKMCRWLWNFLESNLLVIKLSVACGWLRVLSFYVLLLQPFAVNNIDELLVIDVSVGVAKTLICFVDAVSCCGEP